MLTGKMHRVASVIVSVLAALCAGVSCPIELETKPAINNGALLSGSFSTHISTEQKLDESVAGGVDTSE